MIGRLAKQVEPRRSRPTVTQKMDVKTVSLIHDRLRVTPHLPQGDDCRFIIGAGSPDRAGFLNVSGSSI